MPDFKRQESIKKGERETTVCIVGDGNAAHILVPFLGETHHTVNLMSLQPDRWNKEVMCQVQTMKGEVINTFSGHINKLSSDFADVIPDADIIFLCIPVHAYRDALNKLGPYISRAKKEVFVGTIYGQAGFNWMVHEMEKKHNISNTVAFSIGLIPWICRIEEYGSYGLNFGGKQVNVCAVSPPDRFDHLNHIFLQDISYTQLGVGQFVQACSFISLSLSVDNQIVHPSRCFGLWKRYGGKWKTMDDVPFFYKDFDDISAECLKKLDDDYTAVRSAIRKHWSERPFKYMLDYLELEKFAHNSDFTNNKDKLVAIKKSLADSEQLGRIKTPVMKLDDDTYMLNIHHRFFDDDIPYGVLITKWIGEQLGVATPFIDELINWVQEIRPDMKYLTKDNKIDLDACLKDTHTSGIPPTYGIASVEDILD